MAGVDVQSQPGPTAPSTAPSISQRRSRRVFEREDANTQVEGTESPSKRARQEEAAPTQESSQVPWSTSGPISTERPLHFQPGRPRDVPCVRCVELGVQCRSVMIENPRRTVLCFDCYRENIRGRCVTQVVDREPKPRTRNSPPALPAPARGSEDGSSDGSGQATELASSVRAEASVALLDRVHDGSTSADHLEQLRVRGAVAGISEEDQLLYILAEAANEREQAGEARRVAAEATARVRELEDALRVAQNDAARLRDQLEADHLRYPSQTPDEPADALALAGPVPPVIDVEGEDHRRQLEELEARLATALSANTELLQSIADASDEANVFVTLADERTAKADLRAKQAESHAADADAARAHMERSRDDLAQRLDVLRSSAARLADARAERDDVKERLARETRRADEAARQCTADAAQHRRALDALAQEKIAVEQDRDAARDTGAAQTVRAVAAETRAAEADQQLQATAARVQELERALRPLLDAATQVQVLLGTSPMAFNNSEHTK